MSAPINRVNDHMTTCVTNKQGDDFLKNQLDLQINMKLPTDVFGDIDTLTATLTPMFEVLEKMVNDAWLEIQQ